MYHETRNYYKFRYLVTAISGAGLQGVHLPEPPADITKVQNYGKKPADQYWERTPLPADWKTWRKEEKVQLAKDPEYIHPKINAFVEQQWDRRLNGHWIFINGTLTYLTGTYYNYVNWWKADFGYPKFRATDLELHYFVQYCEEDPNCYGPAYNTRRRSGKSAIMGHWQTEAITRMRNAYGGVQGESEKKVKPFFKLAIVEPFKKLPDFFTPTYNTDSKNVVDIEYFKPVRRSRNGFQIDDESEEALESWQNWKGSDIYAYDGRKLHRTIIEEPGKTTEVDVKERHAVLKPCCEEDEDIIGKIFYGTTVEEMEGAGAVYEQLIIEESDFDKRGEDGKTISGLYACLMPSYCNYKFDDYGFPMIPEAMDLLNKKREAQRNNPKDYAAIVRKYPFNWRKHFTVIRISASSTQ